MTPSKNARVAWTAGRRGAGAALLLLAVALPLSADNLSTALDLAVPAQRAGRGDTLTFQVTIANEPGGTSPAPGALAEVSWRTGFSGVTWTAAFSGGASGTAAGSGPVAEPVDLPVGGAVVYTVAGTVVPGIGPDLAPERFLDLYAEVTPPGGFVDDDPTDDRAARQLLVERIAPGGGHFLAGQVISQPTATFALAPGDLDGNGSVDYFWSPFTGAGEVWANGGTGTFSATGQALGSDQHGGAGLGDVDGDGDLDAWQTVVTGPDLLWINQGGAQAGVPGTFADSGQSLDAGSGLAAVFADLDQDGDSDLFLGRSGSATPRVWINQGGAQGGTEGDFADAGPMPGPAGNTQGITVGDVDGDGDLDVFLARSLDDHQLFLGDGSGTFSISPQTFPTTQALDASFGDLDGDGDLDLYLLGFSAADRVLLNQGGAQGGTLGELVDSGAAIGPTDGGNASVSLADADGDGDLDAFAGFYTVNPSQLYLNDGTGGFSASPELSGAQAAFLTETADLDGDGDFDLLLGGLISNVDQVFFNVPEVELAGPLAPAPEGAGVLEFVFTRDAATGSPEVGFTVAGTADFGPDYSVAGATTFGPTAGSVTFAPGQDTLALTVTPLEDGEVEGDETVILTLTAAVNTDYVVGAADSATGTIADSGPPIVSAAKESVFDPQVHDLDGSGDLSPGDLLTYTIAIGNAGTGGALEVAFDDVPDANAPLVAGSVATTQGSIASGNGPGDTAVAIDLGTLGPGATATVTFDVQLADPFPAGVTTISNQGLVSGSGFPPVPTDDPATGAAGDPTVDVVSLGPGPGPEPADIPALGPWGLALLALLLAAAARRALGPRATVRRSATLAVALLVGSLAAGTAAARPADPAGDLGGPTPPGVVQHEDAYLKASNADPGDHLGYAVAADGDTAVVGALQESGDGSGPSNNDLQAAGAAYVLDRDGLGNWTEQVYLKASNPDPNDAFGATVAISGDTLVVATPAEDGDASDPANNDAESAGAAYVFVRDGLGNWTEQAYLKASNAEAEDWFGNAVAISGDTVVVGAPLEDGDGSDPSNNGAVRSGAAYVFVRDGLGNWTEQAYLKASNLDAEDAFGHAVAISGDSLVIGAPSEGGDGSDPSNDDAPFAGAAYIFVRDGMGEWTEQAYLKASNADAADFFGSSVAIAGETVVIGARWESSDGSGPMNNSAFEAGAAYVFVPDGLGGWVEQAYLKSSNADAGDWFGWTVAVAGDAVAVGAYSERGDGADPSDNSLTEAGAAYHFVRDGLGNWTERAYLKASNAGAEDRLGFSVAVLDDGTLLAGAQGEDGDGSGPANNGANFAGALYAFGPRFTVGGLVAGLAGSGLVLQNNGGDDLPIATDGQFAFPTGLADGSAYEVSVLSQPTEPDQLCTVAGGSGVLAGGDVTDVEVACGAPAAPAPIPALGPWGLALLALLIAAAARRVLRSASLAAWLLPVWLLVGPLAAGTASAQSDDPAAALGGPVPPGAVQLEDAYLKASNNESPDQLGHSLAVDGDTAVIGAPGEAGDGVPGAGAAYVFVRDGAGDWIEQAYLKASNPDSQDLFGFSVAVSGDVIVVGAPLEDGDGGAPPNNGADNAGAAYVFVRDGLGNWTEQAYLKASNVGGLDAFGYSVAVSGDTVAVAAVGEDGDGSDPSNNDAISAGAAYVFVSDGLGNWTEQAYLKASNLDAQDAFGHSVALSGDTLVAGALREDGDGSDPSNNDAPFSGAAYVFVRDGLGNWTEQAYLKASNLDGGDQFGNSVAVSGDTLAVGAFEEDGDGGDPMSNGALDSGAVYVFARDGLGDWIEEGYLKASNVEAEDFFGWSVAIAGDEVAVGAPQEDGNGSDPSDNGTSRAGAVYRFVRDGLGGWSERAYLKASNAGMLDQLGNSVAILEDGSVLAGAPSEDGDGSDPTNNGAVNSGAVYAFGPAAGTPAADIPTLSGTAAALLAMLLAGAAVVAMRRRGCQTGPT